MGLLISLKSLYLSAALSGSPVCALPSVKWGEGYVVSNLITILMSCRKLSRAAGFISFIADTHPYHTPIRCPSKKPPRKLQTNKNNNNPKLPTPRCPKPQNFHRKASHHFTDKDASGCLPPICIKLMADWEVMLTLDMTLGVCHQGPFC